MGPTGAGGGVSFAIQQLTGSSTIALPSGGESLIVLATSNGGPTTILTLPSAAAGVSRMLSIRRVDAVGDLIVRAPSGTILGSPTGGDVVLENLSDHVLLVSDGTDWAGL